MEVSWQDIADLKIITPKRFTDERGFFSEVYSKRAFSANGIAQEFVQDNHSLSVKVGTVRGLHFQTPPMAQDKLVRVVRGAILDVAVDLRRSSPTFAKHAAVRLTADNQVQLLIPAGFAHGFCTLEPDTEVIYKVSAYYSPEHDKGLLWNDPALGINWPVAAEDAVLADKDRRWPKLADLPDHFPGL